VDFCYPLEMKKQTGILLATILGSSMVFIDGSVVNVILPVLEKSFSATAEQIQWVVEAYLLFLASLMLIGGSLGDRYGRRKIFLMGAVIFMLASLGCALSPTLLTMVIFRSLQGVGGALLTPGSLAIINGSFPKEERGKAIGTWSGFSALMMVFGPLLGGLLSDYASWRYVFLINVPIGALVLFFSLRYVPESESSRTTEVKQKMDFAGLGLSTLSIGFLVFGLAQSVRWAWIGGLFLLLVFLWNESRVKNPLVLLSFFKNRVFASINLLCFFLYAALSIAFYFLPFNLIQVQGFTATEAGAANLPFIAIMFLSSRFSGGLYQKIGARLPITVGSVLAAVGFLLIAFLPGANAHYFSGFFPGIFVFGIGMSLCVSPLTTAVLQALPETFSGIASAINNSVCRIAGLVGIALMPKIETSSPEFLGNFTRVLCGCAALAFGSALVAFIFLKSERSFQRTVLESP
jgi:EmrB/QacA subfamily drug resistance transporter